MPPKKNAASASEAPVTSLNENETLFIKAIFDSLNTRPDVDFDKVAGIMGLASAMSAKDKFRVISKKHGWSSTDGSGGASSPSKGSLNANTAAKVKRTPLKKKGIAQRKKKAKAEEPEDSDGDEDISAKLESDSDGQKAAKDELKNESSDSD
ncbi:hypothetical protein LX36DRAFT_719013 [Colletotrichum falcatum]|nr:hypothetical protein LX36DRAFT_719013 [Colletotrichum falcatum]